MKLMLFMSSSLSYFPYKMHCTNKTPLPCVPLERAKVLHGVLAMV